MMKKWWTVLGLSLCLGVAACAADDVDDSVSSESAMRVNNTAPQEGGACKIVSGTNTGKTGTYDTTSDPGHTWCCTGANGSGDCTECTGSNACTSAFTRKTADVGFNRGLVKGL